MGDISKKTLAIMLVFAIVVSVVATWTMISSEPSVVVQGPSASSGVASYGLYQDQAPTPPSEARTSVGLSIE